MPRSGSWPTWPINNPDMAEELAARIKHEISQTGEENEHDYWIADLRFSWGLGTFDLNRKVGPENWNVEVVLRGEMNTRALTEWGEAHHAEHALNILRQRQVLEDLANA